jgi:hypothetical protein
MMLSPSVLDHVRRLMDAPVQPSSEDVLRTLPTEIRGALIGAVGRTALLTSIDRAIASLRLEASKADMVSTGPSNVDPKVLPNIVVE